MVRNKTLRIILATLGILSAIIGGIGVVLPVLPTTPFILLAGLLFSFSSERLETWLEHNRFLGPYLKHYRKGTGIPMKMKARTLIILWLGLGISAYIVRTLPLVILLTTIGILVTIHIITIKPRQKESKESS